MTLNLLTLQKKGLQLAIIAGFTGTLWLTFSVGPFHLFPYRVMLILMWMLIFINTTKIYTNRIQVKGSLKFLGFWVIYAMLSLLWAAEKVESIKHIIFLLLNTSLVFFIVYLSDNLKDIKKLVMIWLSIYVILLPIGFWEVITGDHLSNSGLLVVDDGYEFYQFAPTTVFGNQNDYATLIALTFPMLYVCVRYAKRLYSKLFMILLCGASVLMLMFTTSRANYIGVLLGFVFWFLMFLGNKAKLNLSLFFVLFFALSVVSLSKGNVDFLNDIWEDFSTLRDVEDTGTDVRSNLIKNGIYFGLVSGGIGVGAGNIEHYMANSPKYYVGNITNVHNWWIEIFANYGILIFIGYLIFYFNIMWNLWKLHKTLTDRDDKIICEALLCGLVSFSISSLSSSSVMAFNPHWIFFGIALAFINYKRKQEQTQLKLNQ